MAGIDILAAIEARAKDCPRIKIEVPEWGCVLWFLEDITVAQQRKIRAGIKPDDDVALMGSYILHQAQNEDGSQAFEIDANARAVMEGKAGIRVLQRIMTEIGAPETVEEAKNG